MDAESRPRLHNNIAPFEEVIGVVEAIEISDSEVYAILACTYSKSVTVRFPKDTIEAKILKQKLSKLVGQKIAILRIPDPRNSLKIRKVKNRTRKEEVTTAGAKKTVNPMMM